ncbi:MAG: hypothetical protein DRP00_01095 [Candidatus Aenigmatarchaeota archaeon]|nr:MAG: hypothetical protein DRP00_01095 [Candidatus Aenigmarchaeota archaeon]
MVGYIVKFQFIKTVPLLVISLVLGIAIGLALPFMLPSILRSKVNVGDIYILGDGSARKALVIVYSGNRINVTRLSVSEKPIKVRVRLVSLPGYEGYAVVLYNYSRSNLTLSDEQKAATVKILYSYRETRKLLENGYKIDRIKPVYHGDMNKANETFVVLTRDEEMCIALVDLSAEKVEYLSCIWKP